MPSLDEGRLGEGLETADLLSPAVPTVLDLDDPASDPPLQLRERREMERGQSSDGGDSSVMIGLPSARSACYWIGICIQTIPVWKPERFLALTSFARRAQEGCPYTYCKGYRFSNIGECHCKLG